MAAQGATLLLILSLMLSATAGRAQRQVAPVAEQGVTRALAETRGSRLSDIRYALQFAMVEHGNNVTGEETLTFRDHGSGDLALDFRDGTIAAATLNGEPIVSQVEDGHVRLPAAQLHAGLNKLQMKFSSPEAPAGRAFTRYEDRDDGSEYVYTLFVPMDASMAFPCFDQPDLKARFTLTVAHPAGWNVVANAKPMLFQGSGASAATTFAETLPIPTYLFAFAAGPWQTLEGQAGQPALHVRRSQLARAGREAPQVQQMAGRGVAWFSTYFAQPFPFPKYDLVLIPGFPFGGMEHAGATFLNEDSVLFRTAPTASDYFRRNILVLHETCHQWFGDLVTMRWFDDLWLKEGFAQYIAYKALAELETGQGAWKHFYEDIKPLAYGIDETQGTTPIYQTIQNLKDAKSAYGAIVYQKAPAVLKQLNYFVGEETFRDGLRLYLKGHAYANARWADLIAALETAGAASGHPPHLEAWASAWITQRGMPQVDVTWSCNGGRLRDLTLRQHDVLGSAALWPMANRVLLAGEHRPDEFRLDWNTAAKQVNVSGKACPRYVLANAGDEAYGRFLLDDESERVVSSSLVAKAPEALDPLLHSMLWGALWDEVHVAHSAPAAYVELALKTLASETDESLNRIQGGRIAVVLHGYLSTERREQLTPRVETVLAERMLHAATLNLRIVNFRSFISIAATPSALGQLKALLDATLAVPGMPLKPLDRWGTIEHLIAMGDPEARPRFGTEKARDVSGEGQKYAYAVLAADFAPANKDYYFRDYLMNAARQEDWITQSLRPFNSWNQAEETLPYLKLALDALPRIKRERRIFFLTAWLGAFIDGQQSGAAQTLLQSWLKESGQDTLDPDLRLKVLEAADALDRKVAIRRRFPD